MKTHRLARLLCGLCWGVGSAFGADLAATFQRPPASAKPWTYWFWINGNITREGITADLEAMARAGLGGVLIMEVGRPRDMAPEGPIAFGSAAWREMFKHVVAEARRLGLQVSMNNDAGWAGSGGPWNTPEFSMQKIVATTVTIDGSRRVEQALKQPPALHDYYRDIKVLALPAAGKTDHSVRAREAVLDLTGKMDTAGSLIWEAPAGQWQIMRIGCTTTGRMNRPPPLSGQGLECDKLNPEAIRRHFNAFIDQLAADVGPDAGRVFTMTHIDSWEVGTQNWTPRLLEEFQRRRGYELTPWLTVLAGGPPLGSAEETERFRWDFKRTQSEMNDEYYAGALRKLAAQRGLTLSIEAYNDGGFLNPLTYGAVADLPMGEFWISRWQSWHLLSPRLMASVGHVHGRSVIGAESFTARPGEDAFTEHPYSIKALGDWAFAEGINRVVFHRSVLHPWPNLAPGMSFAGFGFHADRHQTWWEPGAAYLQYLTRCQAMLQQGRFVADVCRLVPTGEYYSHRPAMAQLPARYESIPTGYNYDYISDRAVLDEVSVQDGRLKTKSGMSYRLLQLPNARELTPELLRKLHALVQSGASVIGPRPLRSPSLQDYPRCDEEITRLARELWAECDGQQVKAHAFGRGRVFWGQPIGDVLRSLGGGPDFEFAVDPPVTEEALRTVTERARPSGAGEWSGRMPTAGLNWIHRRDGDTDIFFVANPQHRTVHALCRFRVTDRQPEAWDPYTGERRPLAVFRRTADRTEVPLHFDSAGSIFVVFRSRPVASQQVVAIRRNDAVLFGENHPAPAALPEIRNEGNEILLRDAEAGRYALEFADGTRRTVEAPAGSAANVAMAGPWQVQFQPSRGAPPRATFGDLVDWSTHRDTGIRYFSGTASYVREFDWSPRAPRDRWLLDLGNVQVLAQVRLNDADLGVLWKPPYAVDISAALKSGRNRLEVRVTNLWPNRLIGDEQYRDDCTADGSWKSGPIPAWPEWLLKGQARPEPRRVTFTTWKYYTKDSPLSPSGLLGPVVLRASPDVTIKVRER